MKVNLYFIRVLKRHIPSLFLLALVQAFSDAAGISLFIPVMISDVSDINKMAEEIVGIPLPFIIEKYHVLSVIIVFFILKAIIAHLIYFYQAKIQEEESLKVRKKIFDKFFQLEFKEYLSKNQGYWNNIFTVQTEQYSASIRDYLVSFNLIFVTIGYFVLAFINSLVFTLLITVLACIFFTFYRIIYSRTRTVSRNITAGLGSFNTVTSQILQNYPYLIMTASVKSVEPLFSDSIAKLKSIKLKIAWLNGISRSTREPVLILVLIVALYLNDLLLDTSLPSLGLSLLLIYRAINSLTLFQSNYTRFLANYGAVEILNSYLKQGDSSDKIVSSLPEDSNYTLVIQNASIDINGESILKGVDLALQRGEKIVITGPSGSGKSTLLYMIGGLLQPVAGTVKRIKKERLTYVGQDAMLFDDTVYNNVTKWSMKTPDNKEKFDWVCEVACLSDFLQQAPGKEDYLIQHGGSNLSGGQRQRISLARELFSSPSLLILDEVTSGLDEDTENRLYTNLEKMLPNVSIISVAHRPSVIRRHERILTILDNKLVSRV